MSQDARGVDIKRNDLVVWFGRIPGDKARVHLGAVDGFTFFGKIIVSEILHSLDGDWRNSGVTGRVNHLDVLVIDDAPEADE